jgi:formylglycine-generating enzyme required for sulfatase activity
MTKSTVEWIGIPAGTFVMGTAPDSVGMLADRHRDLGIPAGWFLKECPAREVHVPAFAISRNLVTNGELALAAAELGFAWQGEGPPDHPAAVSHWQAAAFCQWLSARTGRLVRLPSEREWERAARGSDAREFPWGDRFDPACANTRESGAGTTAPVGSFPRGASPYRVLDMAGNLDEWTITPYAPYPGAPGDVCATEDWALSPFVTRGGGFNHTRDAARCARRHGVYDDSPVGFRVVSVSGAASG